MAPGAPARLRSKTRLLPAVLLAATGLVLAGCGDGASSESVSPQEAELSSQEQAQAAEPGTYDVGRRTIEVTDPARADRSFPVDIWYPVDPANTGGAAPAQYEFIPGLGYTSEVSLADAPVADGQFPVVVYSHGGGGFRWIATFYTEFLASKGYVVVAPDHPGSTAIDGLTGQIADEQENAFNRPGDITATLDAVEKAGSDAADPLNGHVDTAKIAMSGHSWGGYTSIATVAGHSNSEGQTVPDPRISAIVLMAPYTEMLADDELGEVDVPTLIVSSTLDQSTPIETNTERPAELIAGRPLLRVDITGGGHNSFTDVCALRDSVAENPNVPQPVLDELNDGAEEVCGADVLSVDEIHRITNSYSAAFLAANLSGSTEYNEMLSCVAPPPDAICTVKN